MFKRNNKYYIILMTDKEETSEIKRIYGCFKKENEAINVAVALEESFPEMEFHVETLEIEKKKEIK